MPDQLFHVDGGLPAPRPPTECRVYSRQHCDVATSCQPTSSWGREDARWPATIIEVSLGGVRLVVRRRFERGIGLGIELPGREGDEPYTVLAKVVHINPLPEGFWSLGCKFVSELSEDELRRLVPCRPQATEAAPAPISPSQVAQAAAPATQRKPSGKMSVPEVTLQLEIPDGRVVDCRLPRLGVPGAWPIAPGKILTMRIDTPHGARPLLRLAVVRCRQHGGRWTLRCRLLEPSWEDILPELRTPIQ